MDRLSTLCKRQLQTSFCGIAHLFFTQMSNAVALLIREFWVRGTSMRRHQSQHVSLSSHLQIGTRLSVGLMQAGGDVAWGRRAQGALSLLPASALQRHGLRLATGTHRSEQTSRFRSIHPDQSLRINPSRSILPARSAPMAQYLNFCANQANSPTRGFSRGGCCLQSSAVSRETRPVSCWDSCVRHKRAAMASGDGLHALDQEVEVGCRQGSFFHAE